jgi:hypothetical protein
MRLSGGALPRLFDIIKIPLLEHKPSFYQKENYLIADGQWEKVGEYASDSKSKLQDEPDKIWTDTVPLDRIPVSFLKSNEIESSLLLIKVNKFEIYKSKYKDGLRGLFHYKGLNYDLGITDIDIKRDFESIRAGKYDLYNKYLCISLGEPFKGHSDNEECCYKLIASVVDERSNLPPPECPQCNGKMVKRGGKYGLFWSCQRFPECGGTRNI